MGTGTIMTSILGEEKKKKKSCYLGANSLIFNSARSPCQESPSKPTHDNLLEHATSHQVSPVHYSEN